MKKTIQSTGFALMCLFATWGCSPDAITNYAEEEIVAEQGGVVVTENGITLEIPAGAFEEDGVVFVGKTGDEPTSVPNPDYTVVGEPFTIKLPIDTLIAPLQLSFPLDPDANKDTNGLVLLYNGTSYFPFEYEIVDGKVVVTIDTINWEQVNTKGVVGTLVATLVDSQFQIDDKLLGIKDISIVSNEIVYNTPTNISSSSKILLLIHGLIGTPTTWDDYIKQIFQEPNLLSYTNIWTYGYRSDQAIDSSAEELKELLTQYTKGANPTIHIVAHSMGGLVARSMIETYNGASLIDKLITLGTPHLGSSAAVLRHIIGAVIAIDATVDLLRFDPSGTINLIGYYYNTRGAKDLDPKSKFIDRRKQLESPPPPTLYYTLACNNNDNLMDEFIPNLHLILESPNDGLVTEKSAKGVNGAKSPKFSVTIPIKLAHMNMKTLFKEASSPIQESVLIANRVLYNQVKNYLQQEGLSVTTGQVTNITSTTASCSGNVTSDGGSSVTARGVCWSTTQNPTTADSKTTDGEGPGPYTSNITGLSPNTTYYVRAYATNSEGTAYGEQRTFRTLTASDIEYGSLTDPRDGNEYKTINIGGKEWMAENLKYLPEVVGPATSSQTTSCYYVYGYDGTDVHTAKSTANYQTYGVLYNWPAAMNGAATSNTIPSGVQGACPAGWHLPSDAEWKQMEMYLGMSQSEADSDGWRGTDEGGKMKHPGTEYWGEPNTGATNSSGFTALPGGYIYSSFGQMHGEGFWWSSTQYIDDSAWWHYLSWNESRVSRINPLKGNGLSVRCIKDYQKEPGSSPDYGTFTDQRDQTVYKTITIGGKEWMAENLKYLPEVVGPATNSNTTSCYYVYGYDGTDVNAAKSTANYQTYGVLYNWPAAMNGAATSNTIPSGVQGACPAGWHLPSDAEWKQMEMYLGMSQSEADSDGWRGTDEGGKMKHPGTEYWGEPNTGATNSSGFTALPGGYIYSSFGQMHGEGFWWSSTQSVDDVAWWRYLSYNDSKVGRLLLAKRSGLSLRCVRD